MLLMVVGIYKWPHSPTKQVQDGYEDKRGNHYTNDEYRWFKNWEIAYFVVAGTGLSLIVILQIEKKIRDRNSLRG